MRYIPKIGTQIVLADGRHAVVSIPKGARSEIMFADGHCEPIDADKIDCTLEEDLHRRAPNGIATIQVPMDVYEGRRDFTPEEKATQRHSMEDAGALFRISQELTFLARFLGVDGDQKMPTGRKPRGGRSNKRK